MNKQSGPYPPSAHGNVQRRDFLKLIGTGSVALFAGECEAVNRDLISLEMFGAKSDLVLDENDIRLSGTDNISAIEAMLNYMSLNNADGYIGEGRFYASREVYNWTNRTIFGAGKDLTVLYVECKSNEMGIRTYPQMAGEMGGFDSLTVIVAPIEPKLPHNGQYHACAGVGGVYFTSGTLVKIENFRLTNIRCKRAKTGISSGSAVYIIGYCTGGRVDGIDDIGSKKRHTSGMTTHWSGGGNSEGYGYPSTTSYHPENIRGGSFHFENTDVPLVISSSINIHVRSLYCKGATQLFLALPGDETNRIANAAQKANVGRGIKIDEIYFEDMDPTSNADAIGVFSVGTSSFAFFPGADSSIPLQEQLWLDIQIGSVRGHNTKPPKDKKLFDFFTFHGQYRVGHVDVGDSFTKSIVDIDRSIGYIEFGTLIGKQVKVGKSLVEITRATGVTIGNLKGTHADLTDSNSRVLYLFGDEDATATLVAPTDPGDTEVVISGVPRKQRILKGQRLVIGTQVVRAAAYYPVGATLISIETPGIRAPVPAGAVVTIDSRNREIDVFADLEGGYHGIISQGTQATIRGPGVSGSGFIAARFLAGSDIDIGPTKFARNGLNRIATPDAATREILVEVGAIVRHHGGTLGNEGAFVQYNVGCPKSDVSSDRRYHAIGVQFMEAASGPITASSSTDYLLTACIDAKGAHVTS